MAVIDAKPYAKYNLSDEEFSFGVFFLLLESF